VRRGPAATVGGLAATLGGLAALAALAFPALARAPALVLPASPAGAPTAPGPAPRGRSFDAAALNARCEGCHLEIAAEWRTSLHHRSHADPMVQRQLAREPFPFCRACHAPEASPSGEGPPQLRRLGVGCVTCHVVGDQILAVHRSEGTEHDGEHHPLVRSKALEGPSACGSCHEFAFPGELQRRAPLLMQSTMQEHARSAHADRSCSSCHMPLIKDRTASGHRSHAFAASRDEALVRSAVIVEAAPFVDNTLTLSLRPGSVGHAFPTGDMFRRLMLVIDVLDAGGHPVEHAEHALARHLGYSHLPNLVPRRIVTKDNRVGAGQGAVVVRHTARRVPAGGHLVYALRYERVEDTGDGAGGPPVVEGSILLSTGSFALAPPAAGP
jgi:hypothetical protein